MMGRRERVKPVIRGKKELYRKIKNPEHGNAPGEIAWFFLCFRFQFSAPPRATNSGKDPERPKVRENIVPMEGKVKQDRKNAL